MATKSQPEGNETRIEYNEFYAICFAIYSQVVNKSTHRTILFEFFAIIYVHSNTKSKSGNTVQLKGYKKFCNNATRCIGNAFL